jgi:hypothetical protein
MKGPDVAAASPSKWVLLYLSGATGTTEGVGYGGQQSTLPFSAGYHVRWKTDNLYTNAQAYNGTSWADANWDFAGDVYQTGDFVELRIPLADIGSPSAVSLAMLMLNEASNGQWSYAGVPAGLLTDGFDPDYAKYFTFTLTEATAPGGYAPLP